MLLFFFVCFFVCFCFLFVFLFHGMAAPKFVEERTLDEEQ